MSEFVSGYDPEQAARDFVIELDTLRARLQSERVYESCAFEDLKVSPERLEHAKQVAGRAYVNGANRLWWRTADMPGTSVHQYETAVEAVLLVEQMGYFDEDWQELAAMIGLIHDSAKSDTDIRPLVEAPRRLTADERKVVAKHTTHGAQYAFEAGLPPAVVIGVLLHQSQRLGMGDDLEEEMRQQPEVTSELAQVFGDVMTGPNRLILPYIYTAVVIADVYSALSSSGDGRRYKPVEFDVEKKLKIISDSHRFPRNAELDPCQAVYDLTGQSKAA